jgi:pyruvate,water dikinase
MRVNFVAEILEDLEFRVTIKQDHLLARIETQEMPFILKRLEVLGHLILHTRQLDVIMANSDQVEYYREKLKSQLESILSTVAKQDDLTLDVRSAQGQQDASASPPPTSS